MIFLSPCLTGQTIRAYLPLSCTSSTLVVDFFVSTRSESVMSLRKGSDGKSCKKSIYCTWANYTIALIARLISCYFFFKWEFIVLKPLLLLTYNLFASVVGRLLELVDIFSPSHGALYWFNKPEKDTNFHNSLRTCPTFVWQKNRTTATARFYVEKGRPLCAPSSCMCAPLVWVFAKPALHKSFFPWTISLEIGYVSFVGKIPIRKWSYLLVFLFPAVVNSVPDWTDKPRRRLQKAAMLEMWHMIRSLKKSETSGFGVIHLGGRNRRFRCIVFILKVF